MGNFTTPHRRRATVAASILAAALAVTACSGADDSTDVAADDAADTADQPAGDRSEPSELLGVAPPDAGTADAGDAAPLASGEPTGETGSGFDIGALGRDVIVEMRVVLASDDVARAVSSVRATASALGGGVAAADERYDDRPDGRGQYAVLTVKVPPDAVDRLMAGLDGIGTVRSIDQSAQDVTDQLVDLDVRIRNARQSVANVRAFMERAEDLGELVSLEGELTRRQTELEQLEAQERNLADRVALATVTIEIVTAEPADDTVDVAEEDDDTVADAFARGWDALAGVLFAIAFAAAVAAPFLALGALLVLIAWVLTRLVGRRGRTGRPADDRPADDGRTGGAPDDGSPGDGSADRPVPAGDTR